MEPKRQKKVWFSAFYRTFGADVGFFIFTPHVSPYTAADNMWSYKYTSSSSIFVDQCRVGVRLQASSPVAQLVELFTVVSKEQASKVLHTDDFLPLSAEYLYGIASLSPWCSRVGITAVDGIKLVFLSRPYYVPNSANTF